MAYDAWKQIKEGEQKAEQASIGKVFLIDRGERLPSLGGQPAVARPVL